MSSRGSPRLSAAINQEHAKSPSTRKRTLPKPRFSLGQGTTTGIGRRGRRTGFEAERDVQRGPDDLEDFSEYFRSDDEEYSTAEEFSEEAVVTPARSARATPASARKAATPKSATPRGRATPKKVTPKSATPRGRATPRKKTPTPVAVRVSPRRSPRSSAGASAALSPAEEDAQMSSGAELADFDDQMGGFDDDGFGMGEDEPSPEPSPEPAPRRRVSSAAKTARRSPKKASAAKPPARPRARNVSAKRRREEEDLLMSAGSLVPPSMSPAAGSVPATIERRSKRQRHRPLQYWLNERIEYAPHRDGIYPDEGHYVPAQLNAPPPRPPRGSTGGKDEKIPEVTVFDRKTKEQVPMKLAKSKTEVVPRKVPSYTVTSSAFEEEDFVSGVVIIPGKTKEQSKTDKTEVFYVDYGAVEVKIGKSKETMRLKRGAHFFLPRGVRYTIENKAASNCVLVFFSPS